jgi:microcystin-dependent protein
MRSVARFVMTTIIVHIFASPVLVGAAHAQEAFIGEVRWVAFDFPPRGWALCDGQLLSISQNTALFSLIGTTYGGDGQTTFALPDLRGRVPLHPGQGPGLTSRLLGESAGLEEVALSTTQLPTHTHSLNAVDMAAADSSPVENALAEVSPAGGASETQGCVNQTNGKVRIVSGAASCRRHEIPTALGGGSSDGTKIYASQAPDSPMHPQSIGEAGAGDFHPNMQPYLGLNCVIALQGFFPPRN